MLCVRRNKEGGLKNILGTFWAQGGKMLRAAYKACHNLWHKYMWQKDLRLS